MKFKKYYLACLFICLLQASQVHAQKETNIWYFGHNAGLDFNGSAPVALTNSSLHTEEGTSVASDGSGNLIFYTNGSRVYNKNHLKMPNGSSLYGHPTTTQTLIVQQPGSSRYYYIFTATMQAQPEGFRYTQIDMSLDGGLGDVVLSQKNVPLYVPTCEKMVGIKHCNNKDVWVVSREYDSNGFRAYLVTSAGVDTVPVISNAGVVIATHSSGRSAIGQLKASSDGSKLASASAFNVNRFELFDFNTSTGVVSNAIAFPMMTIPSDSGGAYGVEFSPDMTKLYCGFYNDFYGKIYQFDLCAGSDSAIANSGILIAALPSNVGSFQLGPDKKIYVARLKQSWLGIINNPNIAGVGCNYVHNGISLGGPNSFLGLPNFVSGFFKAPIPGFTASANCLKASFAPPVFNVSNCPGSASAITSFSWDFGDLNSGINNTSVISNPTHLFSDTGTYNVLLIINYPCGADTFLQPVSIFTSVNFYSGIVSTATDCDTANGTIGVSGGNGNPPLNYLWSNGQTGPVATGLDIGTYSVTIVDVNGCKQSVSAGIVPKTATANAGEDVTIIPGASIQLNATGGNNYSWNPLEGLSCTNCPDPIANPLLPTIYCVTVTDTNGCSASDCMKVDIDCGHIFVPNAFSPNDDTENDLACVLARCLESVHFVIFNRLGEKVFESFDKEMCWDGKYRGQLEASAVFGYYLEATLIDGKRISKKGNISLIR